MGEEPVHSSGRVLSSAMRSLPGVARVGKPILAARLLSPDLGLSRAISRLRPCRCYSSFSFLDSSGSVLSKYGQPPALQVTVLHVPCYSVSLCCDVFALCLPQGTPSTVCLSYGGSSLRICRSSVSNMRIPREAFQGTRNADTLFSV